MEYIGMGNSVAEISRHLWYGCTNC